MKTPELLPCPFCGGKAELVHHECKMNDIKIQCTNCHVKTDCERNLGKFESAYW